MITMSAGSGISSDRRNVDMGVWAHGRRPISSNGVQFNPSADCTWNCVRLTHRRCNPPRSPELHTIPWHPPRTPRIRVAVIKIPTSRTSPNARLSGDSRSRRVVRRSSSAWAAWSTWRTLRLACFVTRCRVFHSSRPAGHCPAPPGGGRRGGPGRTPTTRSRPAASPRSGAPTGSHSSSWRLALAGRQPLALVGRAAPAERVEFNEPFQIATPLSLRQPRGLLPLVGAAPVAVARPRACRPPRTSRRPPPGGPAFPDSRRKRARPGG